MKRHVLTAIAAAIAVVAQAQVWTLDSCISYAIEHNITVRQQEAQIRSAEVQVTQARSGYLPNVSANLSQSWNIGRGLTAQNTYANRNTSSFNWGASLQMPVFDGLSTPRRVAYAKANLAEVTARYDAAREDVTVNVITYYLQALYCREMAEVADRQVALSEYELTRRSALLEAGKIPEVEMLEAEAQLASDRYNAVQAHNDYILATVDLAQLLRLPADIEHAGNSPVMEVQPLGDDHPMLISPDEAYSKALVYSHSIRAAREGVNAADANITLSRSGYLPTLSFGTSVGSQYYNVSGFDNEKFGAQMRHNFSTYFGFQLNVPIFDAFSTRNSVRQAKASRLSAQLQLDQAEDQLLRAIQQAYHQALSAQKKYDASVVAEEAATKAFEAMQEKYNIGRATPTEFEQAKLKALNATADRIQANYEVILRSRLLAFYASPH